MTQSPYTLFYLFLTLLLSVGLAYLEVAWLRRTPQLSMIWPSLIPVAIVNFAILLFAIYCTLVDSYMGYFFFPLPIGQIVFLFVKIVAFYILQRILNIEFHSIWRVTIVMLFAGAITSSIVLSFAESINPTYQNFYQAITGNKDGKLLTMIWISVPNDKIMTDLINTALSVDNKYAVRKLTRHGADPKGIYNYNLTSSLDATWELVKWQLDNANDVNEIPAIDQIISAFSVEQLTYGLDKGIDIKKFPGFLQAAIRNYEHNRPRMKESEELVDKLKLLIDRGADINSKDSYGYKPISALFILQLPKEPVLRLLIDHGANVNEQTPQEINIASDQYMPAGFTPLMSAALMGDVASVKLLLEKGADKNIKNSQDKTARDYAKASVTDDRILELL